MSYHSRERKTSLRLSRHDYVSANFYYVTLLTRNREYFLGEIINQKIQLSGIGNIVCNEWLELPKYFPDLELDEFVIMPNHIHGILKRNNLTREELNTMNSPEKTKAHLSKIIRRYKANCTRLINRSQDICFFSWHKNYYDHIVRNNEALNKIRKYIRENPANWHEDEYV